ncbi:MAG: hypothetical protein M1832_002757 [Thelocarpon impressellum]|nr:MAG: hypothetical protein M1832_002757 [Thelocarpon impressellum]
MHDARPHPILAQVPLTVSPFISLPTATTLPYTYKSLPSTLPPSSTGETAGAEKARYVVSSAGHAAHPDEIIASCQALQQHLKQTHEDADRLIREWEESIRERELAEKRRLAPGWLDRDEKILQPERAMQGITESSPSTLPGSGEETGTEAPSGPSGPSGGQQDTKPSSEGEELDRAFGGLGLR